MKKGICGSTLKIIALVSMLIDHIAAVIITGIYLESGNQVYYWIQFVMRAIGRLAFPIFCFLLVEGFFYTKNKVKYVLRLGAFAMISEIPFDLAFQGSVLEFTYQNVFFTLTAGLLVLIGWKMVNDHFQLSNENGFDKKNIVIRVILMAVILMAALLAVYEMHTDYDVMGVLAIVIMYLIRKKQVALSENRKRANASLAMTAAVVVLSVFSSFEIFAIADAGIVAFYNGKRGLKLKYLFYIFYPVHLLVIYFIAKYFGWQVTIR